VIVDRREAITTAAAIAEPGRRDSHCRKGPWGLSGGEGAWNTTSTTAR